MTNIEMAKEYLQSYRNLCCKLKSLEEQLKGLKEVEQSAKIQQLSDMPKGNRQSDLSDIMVKMEVLETKILQKKYECENRKLEIEELIAGIPDGTESMVLRKRYIEFKTWEQICVEIEYSWRQTHYIHGRALTGINIA